MFDNRVSSVRCWYELVVRDFVRQRLARVVGDRVAGFVPEEAAGIGQEFRVTRFVTATVPALIFLRTLEGTVPLTHLIQSRSVQVSAEDLAAAKTACRDREVTFHSFLCASLLTAYAKERAERHPPAPFTAERIMRGVTLLCVALIATVASATGSNKVCFYSRGASFLSSTLFPMCL